MRNAQEIIEAIHGSQQTGNKVGLQNTRRLLEALNVSSRMPAIHVAGTNGKGSVCAMLECILRRAGLRTGLYTSPFLQAYPERIRLNGQPISDAVLEKYGNPLLETSERLAREEDIHATPFEHGTALAFSVFQGEKVDVAVVEVGLGGRLDPTNVIVPDVCAITAIGLDHMHTLGNTIEAIAGEKAGIIKPGVPVVCQAAQPSVAAVFAETARRQDAPLVQLEENMLLSGICDAHGSDASYQIGGDRWEQLRLSLPGEHQLQNAMTVLGVVAQLRKLGYDIPDAAVRQGLATTVWPARLEWCGNILIDGAHNAHGVTALRRFVQAHLMDRRRVMISGVLKDKLTPDMLKLLRDLAQDAFTIMPDSYRALDAEAYAAAMRGEGVQAEACGTLEEALKNARKLAGQDGVIIACGSLYFAGEVRNALGLAWR